MLVDNHLYDLVSRRAAYPCWLKYGINKMELKMLGQLSSYLKFRNSTVVGKHDFFDTVTNNSREKVRMEGYLSGLIKGRFIGCYEYVSSPDGLSLGLSDLGVQVLIDFDSDVQVLLEKYKPSPYRLDTDIIPSFSQEPRARYIPKRMA